MNNIKFNYLYRDSANYKIFGSIVFGNDERVPVAKIDKEIREHLIDSEFFDPCLYKIPQLKHEEFLFVDELDHSWNEYVSVEDTEDQVSDTRTITMFLNSIKKITRSK